MSTLHRIGDTFHAELTYADDTGAAINLTDAAIVPIGIVQRPGTSFTRQITARLSPQSSNPGAFSLTADTSAWTEGDAIFFVTYDSGTISSTDPVHIVLVVDTGVGDAGDGQMDVSPILADVVVPNERLALIPATPAAGDIVPLFTGPLDPGDRRLLAIDFSAVLGDADIATIEWIGFDATAAALGFRIATGTRRPILDTTRRRVGVYVECDESFQQALSYAGTGIVASIRARVTIAGTLDEAVERSAPFTVRQL